MSVDDAIAKLYGEFDIPSDQIATNATFGGEFTAKVNKLLPEGQEIDQQTCVNRLIYLRKRGFLKRLRRRKRNNI